MHIPNSGAHKKKVHSNQFKMLEYCTRRVMLLERNWQGNLEESWTFLSVDFKCCREDCTHYFYLTSIFILEGIGRGGGSKFDH